MVRRYKKHSEQEINRSFQLEFPKEENHFGRQKRLWENNIKMKLEEK